MKFISMRKIITFTLLLSLVALFACNKLKPYDGGFWTFKSVKYVSTSSHYVRGAFVAYTGTGFPTGSLNFRFSHDPDSIYPLAGNYFATDQLSPAIDDSHVFISLSDSSATRFYYSTASQSTPLTVTRTNGKITITMPSVELVSTSDPSDSSAVSGTLIQTPQ